MEKVFLWKQKGTYSETSHSFHSYNLFVFFFMKKKQNPSLLMFSNPILNYYFIINESHHYFLDSLISHSVYKISENG